MIQDELVYIHMEARYIFLFVCIYRHRIFHMKQKTNKTTTTMKNNLCDEILMCVQKKPKQLNN